MATTETRSGFRLPWSSGDDAHHDDQLAPAGPTKAAPPAAPAAESTTEAGSPTSVDLAPEPPTSVELDTATEPQAEPEQPTVPEVPPMPEATTTPAPTPEIPVVSQAPSPEARPNEFLAGLTRAMRTAAEAEREQIVARFDDQAREFMAAIRDRSAEQADDLRRQADDDIEGIHSWSERELARIREETERRIERRRTRLDEELDGNTAAADRQVEHVEAKVASFDQEMERFFEGLLAEEDPARFAALAASLPVPPSLETEDVRAAATSPAPEAQPIATAPPVTDPVWAGAVAADTDEAVVPTTSTAAADPWRDLPAGGPQAGSTDDASADVDTDAEPEGPAIDPRVAALGLTPDFAAAEAEAAAAADEDPEEGRDMDPQAADPGVAARLAGLTAPDESGTGVTTRLIVVGLVSVASIAGFKRQLGRLPGVSKVGVSSGPDGEFVFAVTHADGLDLRDPVTTLPGYGARVIGAEDDALKIECHDPESNG